jgi:DNA invertase Pin-like site-specific DNA recombinase
LKKNPATNLRRERQMEGIKAAKARGVYKGRPPSIKPEAVAALKVEGLGATAIAKRLGINRASVYRLLGDLCDHGGPGRIIIATLARIRRAMKRGG